ncbi:hypothetical protein XENOCAPTIV_021353, partial [Xenoophorus captivus]
MTPKVTAKVVPQTEGKKRTSAQEERMRKLQEWRQSKGISYKRPPMPVKPQVTRAVSVPHPFWASMNVEDEARSLISALDRSLADCIKLLAEVRSCNMFKSTTVAKQFLMNHQNGSSHDIHFGGESCLLFCSLFHCFFQPVDELRTVVFDILKKKDEIQGNEKQEDDCPTTETSPDHGSNPLVTPKPAKALIKRDRGGSSVVKYKITATPG